MYHFTQSQLEEKSRKEIQALAKELGLKANAATQVLVASILEKCPTEVKDEPIVKEEKLEVVTEIISLIEESSKTQLEMPEMQFETGCAVEVFVNGKWSTAVIKRVNKKTIRVQLSNSQNEVTVKNEECRWPIVNVTVAAETQPMEIVHDQLVPSGDISTNAPLTQDFECVTEQESEVTLNAEDLSSKSPVALVAVTPKRIFSMSSPVSHDPMDEQTDAADEIDMVAEYEPESSELVLAPTPAPSHIARKRKSLEIRKSLTKLSETISKIEPDTKSSIKQSVLAPTSADIRKETLPRTQPTSAIRTIDTKFSSGIPKARTFTTASNSTNGKKAVPDFSKSHASHFSGQKSILAVVHRKESVVLNMEKAMANAQLGVVPEHSVAVVAAPTSVKTTSHAAGEPSIPQFKARPMPNFKAVHEKAAAKPTSTLKSKPRTPVKSTVHVAAGIVKNKENNSTCNASGAPVEISKNDIKRDERKTLFMDKKREDRKAMFLAQRRSIGTPNSKAAFGSSSLSLATTKFPSSPKIGYKAAENPFHYCN